MDTRRSQQVPPGEGGWGRRLQDSGFSSERQRRSEHVQPHRSVNTPTTTELGTLSNCEDVNADPGELHACSWVQGLPERIQNVSPPPTIVTRHCNLATGSSPAGRLELCAPKRESPNLAL